ncbi:MAG: hypothetical protein CMK59_02955 [Proteobacteria bacterium]|nr:hypothetical protein [Pseudomonadota bacterium]
MHTHTFPSILVPASLVLLAEKTAVLGGRLYLVGGAVRDHLLGIKPKDWDLELHGIPPEKVQLICKTASPVGKSYGVWKVQIQNEQESIELDISIPIVSDKIEPYIGLEQATLRRDLTINAIYYDLLSQEFLDPFGGINDLQNKVLKSPCSTNISKDPLRVFRVARFASVFSFTPCSDLILSGQSLSQEQLNFIAGERITMELNKIFLKSPAPSKGFKWLKQLKVMERLFPEWNIDPCFNALDKGAAVKIPYPQKLTLMWSIALSHTPTKHQESILDQCFLHTIERYPMRTFVFKSSSVWKKLELPCSDKELFLLAEELELRLLCLLADSFNATAAQTNLSKAIELGVEQNPLPALLQGRHFQKSGIHGKAIGEGLRELRKAQFEGKVRTFTDAQNWLTEYSSNL